MKAKLIAFNYPKCCEETYSQTGLREDGGSIDTETRRSGKLVCDLVHAVRCRSVG